MKKGVAVMLALLMVGMSIRFPWDVSIAVQVEGEFASSEEVREIETAAAEEKITEAETESEKITEVEIETEKITETGAELESEEITEAGREEENKKELGSAWEENNYYTKDKKNEDYNLPVYESETRSEKKDNTEAVSGASVDILDSEIGLVSLQIPQQMDIVIDPWKWMEKGKFIQNNM